MRPPHRPMFPVGGILAVLVVVCAGIFAFYGTTIAVAAATQAGHRADDRPYILGDVPETSAGQMSCIFVHIVDQTVGAAIAHQPGRQVPLFLVEGVGPMPEDSAAFSRALQNAVYPDGMLCVSIAGMPRPNP